MNISRRTEFLRSQQKLECLQEKYQKVLPVSRAVIYREPNPQSEILFVQRPMESKNHRGLWEIPGGKREWITNQPFDHKQYLEASSVRIDQEIWQETVMPHSSYYELPLPVSEHEYVLDDGISSFCGYLIWTTVHMFSLHHPDTSRYIRTPEHQNHVWLTANEALEYSNSGFFQLQPQAEFILPRIVENARSGTWR